ncbi:MAG: hypothetical protein WC761_01125 [Candidatus Paceibacterota bacterium]|jgi:hypothetical protein
MELSQAYEKLIIGSELGGISYFVVFPDGVISQVMPHNFTLGRAQMAVVPGSFDPVHRAHRWMFDKENITGKCFEMSVKRWDKPNVSFEDMERKLAQFKGYASVLVTNQPRMIGKIGLIRTVHPHMIPTFHIGADTLIRMYDDYGKVGVAGLAASFIVHDRVMNGELLSVSSHEHPANCHSPSMAMPDSMLDISSSAIRAKNKIG